MDRHPIRNVLLVSLLAVTCIAGAELAASRHFAPEFYERVTAPVRAGAAWVAEQSVKLGHNISASFSALSQRISDAIAEARAPDPILVTLTPPTPTPAPSLTAFVEEDGQEILTGGTLPVVYFNQKDPMWADKRYGTDDIARYGCGPTTMAMAAATLTHADCNPETVARWAYQNHQWVKRSGSRFSIVERVASAYGMTARSLREKTPDALEDALLAGNLVVALMGPGHFTDGGHFILLRGCTLTGSILVADPNSRELSLMEWDPQVILDELSTGTANGAPLWVLSANS